jgi:hypothetical protein
MRAKPYGFGKPVRAGQRRGTRVGGADCGERDVIAKGWSRMSNDLKLGWSYKKLDELGFVGRGRGQDIVLGTTLLCTVVLIHFFKLAM